MGEDIAELFFIIFGDTHLPEAIFDVKLAEGNGALGGGSGCHSIDDLVEDFAELIHGGGWGRGLIGELINRGRAMVVVAALAFVRKIQNHAVGPAFVWDCCNGADLGVGFAASEDELPQGGPGNQFGKLLGNFFKSFSAKGSRGCWGFG